MKKTIIFAIITLVILLSFEKSYAVPEIDDEVLVGFEHGDAKAIPDWVKTTMGFYLKDQISEREILDAFNYLFENNIMQLSQEAAQEVQEMRNEIDNLKQELEETKAAIAIPNLIEARKGANESSASETSGERIMQPEFGAEDGTQTKVIVRGWDPEQKESTTEANKEAVQRFVVELYAESISLSQNALWIPMMEGEVLSGFEEGDLDRPIIVGRIYNTESPPGSHVAPSQTTVILAEIMSDSDFVGQTVDDVLRKGGTGSACEDGMETVKTDSVDRSAIPELQGIVVLCNIEIDKKIQRIDAELEIIEQWLEIISKEQEGSSLDTSRLASGDTGEYVQQYNQSDLDFIKRHLISIDQQIKALGTGVEVFEEKLSSIGDDAQLANIDLQNALQKQQQILQTISNVSKMNHDTMMSIINNMR